MLSDQESLAAAFAYDQRYILQVLVSRYKVGAKGRTAWTEWQVAMVTAAVFRMSILAGS